MSLQDRSAGRTFAIGGNIQFPRFRCCVSANCKYPNGAEAPGDSGHFTAVARWRGRSGRRQPNHHRYRTGRVFV
jgi:hypothetical protein